MAKYHINPETGNPGVCRAKVKCRFGDLEADHYSSKNEAQIAYEQKMATTVTPISKKIIKPKFDHKYEKEQIFKKNLGELSEEACAFSVLTQDNDIVEIKLGDSFQLVRTPTGVDILKDGQRISSATAEEMKNLSKIVAAGDIDAARKATFKFNAKYGIEADSMKAPSSQKSDLIYVSRDGSKYTGASVKSEAGSPPTYLSVSQASQVEFSVNNMNPEQIKKAKEIIARLDLPKDDPNRVSKTGLFRELNKAGIHHDTATPSEKFLEGIAQEDPGIKDAYVAATIAASSGDRHYQPKTEHSQAHEIMLKSLAKGYTPGGVSEDPAEEIFTLKKDGSVTIRKIDEIDFTNEVVMDTPSGSRLKDPVIEGDTLKFYLSPQIRSKKLT